MRTRILALILLLIVLPGCGSLPTIAAGAAMVKPGVVASCDFARFYVRNVCSLVDQEPGAGAEFPADAGTDAGDAAHP